MIDDSNDQTTAPAVAGGWDVVFAIRASDVNKALANSDYPKTISVAKAADGSGPWAHGSIDSWQIVAGGDPKHIPFRVHLRDLVFGGSYCPPEGTTVASLDITVTLGLAFIRQSQDSTTHQLKLAPLETPSGDNQPLVCSLSREAVTALNLGLPERRALVAVLNGWVIDQIPTFAHVFAEIEKFDDLATGDFAWLKATAIDYAYAPCANDTNLDDAALGVLAMTNGRDDSANVISISSQVIPEGSRAVCLIDQGLYLKYGLLPHMPALIAGADDSCFELVAEQNLIKLVKPVSMPSVRSSDGTQSPCDLVELEFEVKGDEVRIRTRTCVSVKQTVTRATSPGMYGQPGQSVTTIEDVCSALAESTDFYKMSPGPRQNGVQTITFTRTRGEPGRQWVEPPGGQDPDKGFLDTFARYASLAVTLGAAFLDPLLGAGYMLAFSVGSAVNSVTGDVSELHDYTKAPYLDNNAIQSALTLRWGGVKDYQLTSVALNNGLQFAGTIGFG